MADEEKASSLQSDEQHDDDHCNQSEEMEFKVADLNDEHIPGWRLATFADVENHMDQVKSELCGMTFNTCVLQDGTVGGPGYGYQLTNKIDNTLEFKLLVNDPNAATTLDMKTTEALPVYEGVIDSNIIIKHADEKKVQVEITSLVQELSSDLIATGEGNISTETHITQQNTNEILTALTEGSMQTSIDSIQNDIDSSGNKEDVIVDTSYTEEACEEIDNNDIKIVVESSVVVVEENTGDVILQENICAGDSHASVEADTSQANINGNAGSGNESDVSAVPLVDATNDSVKPSDVSDLESGKSTDSSPSLRKKKIKPMSASMQRLTAKKESPDFKRSTDLLSAAERKTKADDLRKKKISEQRNKDDERRAAVLERKRKLEDAEREKKEALFKKLTTKDPEKPLIKQTPMRKRYSLSTSNLAQLKKNKLVEVKVDLNITTTPKKTEYKPRERVKLTDRPRSAMQRNSMGVPPQKNKQTNLDTKKGIDVKRPISAFGLKTLPATSKPPTKTSSRPPPKPNTALPARPATSLGISNVEKRKSLPTKQPKTEKPPLSIGKSMQKSKSTTVLNTKDVKKPAPSNHSEKKAHQSPEKRLPKDILNDIAAERKKEKEKEQKAHKKSRKSNAKKETKQMTEEEAKRALAERRKKAKEEAEAKAKEEREKDVVEQLRREEEEKRLAEQLKLEEEKQTTLLEQLKKEEEERRHKLIGEKEQREREERERLEDEQRQREEEIERKAKLELDKIQKEQEKQELLLDQERIERKKRVEMIMARVSSKRNTGADDTEPMESSTPPILSPPEQLSTDPARLKVNDILRSRGFGRSTEDISIIAQEKYEESSGKPDLYENVTANEQLNTTDATTPNINDTPVNNESQGVKLLGSVVIDSPVSMDDDCVVPLDESPPFPGIHEEMTATSHEEAPCEAPCVSFDKPLFSDETNHASLKTDIISADDVEQNNERGTSAEFDVNDAQKIDNISAYLNYELAENIDELSLSSDVEQVNNHASLNDTNNNKDFLIENRSEPIVAWSEREPNSQHEANEKIQNHDTEGDNGCIDKLSNQGHNDASVFMNGNQDATSKVINGSGNLHLISDSSLLVNSEDTSIETESDQWNKFDERIKQIQPNVDQVPGSEENKLWKVLEGKVELSECF